MVRVVLSFLALFVFVGGEFLGDKAHAQPALPGALRVRESKPVTVNGAKFVVVAQTEWQPGKPNVSFPTVAPVEIQLRITNVSKSDILLPTSGTFGVKVLKADGKHIAARAGGNSTGVARPVLIPAGASYSLWRRAEMRWDAKPRRPSCSTMTEPGHNALSGR